jgi:D-alanyl-D-alanine dipeptidase
MSGLGANQPFSPVSTSCAIEPIPRIEWSSADVGRFAPLTLVLAQAFLIVTGAVGTAFGDNVMPEDFVYLRDIDPTIDQDMRYAGPDNFTGAPVPGYEANECVLVREAAEALTKVQADLKPKGLTLRVYDCYRPTKAVDAFVDWAEEPDDPKVRSMHYPNLQKTDLFPDYIATRSGHSRGATLDLTLAPIDGADTSAQEGSCTAPQKTAAPDGSLAMGTTFDCFDVKANTNTSGLTPHEIENRQTLLEAMQTHSFKNYPLEWWHFTFEPEPHPNTYFGFPIRPRPGSGKD